MPGVYLKTSMSSVEEFAERFFRYARQGIPIICICITTKFSGSMQAALAAKEAVKEQCPGARIAVIDGAAGAVPWGSWTI